MDNILWFVVLAAFGGGIIGAYLGALPVFILTGLVAIAGGVVGIAGGADASIGYVTFGAYLGPHVAFAGGVGAAAYAGRMKKLESGADILSSLYGLKDPMTLLVGGLFGVAGMILFQLWGILELPTDHPGLSVFILAIFARLAFGKTGLLGKYEGEGKREWLPSGKEFFNNLLLGLGLGIAISFVADQMATAGMSHELMRLFPILCFGIAATSLIFTQTGFATPATHHIAYPAACAAVWSGNPWMGVIFGVVGALLGDLVGKTLNSHCDTHIDPPATTIFILIFFCTIFWN